MVGETYFSKLASDTLSDKGIRRQSREANSIAEHIVPSILGLQQEEQKAFLYTLFYTLAEEGDGEKTSRSEFALDILANPAMFPIIFTHAEDVSIAYIRAVELQTPENDPYSGSIYFLLEAGKCIAPFLPNKPMRRKLLQTWREIISKFTDGDKRTDIILEVNNIQNMMSPNPELDYHVRELRLSGLTLRQIAEKLDKSVRQIIASNARLIALGLIEPKYRNKSMNNFIEPGA